jgi:type IV pilus assembly protein PilE
MIAAALVAIIATIALPSYRSSMLKSKRAEGRTAVLDVLQQQERYITQKGVYAQFDFGDSSGPVGSLFKTHSGNTAATGAYLISSTSCPPPNDNPKLCIQVLAKPQPITGEPDPEVRVLQATSIGERTCTGSRPALCW